MREMIVDVFAGGGGASLGIQQALGVEVDLAINHDPEAMVMHAANHPGTAHGCADVWSVDPREAVAGRPVGIAWFSPDCTHFSRAKGGKPVQRRIRSLAWVVVRWAKAVRPRVIILENVLEFRGWGPLTSDNLPDRSKAGKTYQLWCNQLRGMGYRLEGRELRACDYGVPTIRKRLFVIARCDGEPIVWPEPTHGEPGNLFGLPPYRTAAECIDWSLPCPSIFERKRPLAEKTLERIARGIRKFVIETGDPFVIKFRRGATGQPIWEPLHTVTAGSYIKRPAGAGHAMGLVTPYLTSYHGAKGNEARGQEIEEPLRTVDTSNRFAITAATLIQTGYGERQGQAPRVPGLDKPLGTAVGTGKHAMVSACLMTNTSGHGPHAATEPVPTVTTGNHQYAVAAFLSRYNGCSVGSSAAEPGPAAVANAHDAIVTTHLTKLYGTATGSDMRDPMPTVTGGGQHLAEVRAFLVKYYATAIGQSCAEPMHTLTTKARLGLVTVHGQDYQICDIGLRMLTPRELARAQGFPDSYILMGTKNNQVSKIGNSFPPAWAEALVRANVRLREIEQAIEGIA